MSGASVLGPVEIAGEPTIDHLEKALLIMAYVVDRYGPRFLPLFDKLETELTELRRREESATSRAMRVLRSHMQNERITI